MYIQYVLRMAFNNTPVLQPFTLLSYVTCMWFHSLDFIHFIFNRTAKMKSRTSCCAFQESCYLFTFCGTLWALLFGDSFLNYCSCGIFFHLLKSTWIALEWLIKVCTQPCAITSWFLFRLFNVRVQVTPWACACVYSIYIQHLSDRLLQAAPFSVSFHSVLYAHVACASIFCQWQIISKGPSVTEQNCCCLFGLLCLENHSSTAVSELQTFESVHKKAHCVFFLPELGKRNIYVLRWQWHINGCYFAEFFLYQSLTQLKCSLLKFCVIFLFFKNKHKKTLSETENTN